MGNHEVRQQLSPEQEAVIAGFREQINALEQEHTPVAEQIAEYPQTPEAILRNDAVAGIGHSARVVSLLRNAAEQVPLLVVS